MPLEPDGFTSLLLTIGLLVVVLWGAVWLMRRMRPGGAGTWGNSDCAVLRSLSLGPRERLLIVRVGTRHLVLGVGSASVSLLCELDGPLQPPGTADGAFGVAMRQAVDRWRGR